MREWYRYYESYKTKGVKELLKTHYKGSEGKLTDRELLELDEQLQKGYWRTTKQVIYFVEQEFDVRFSMSGMNSLLKRLGYVYKKPKCVPGKADREAQKKFLRRYRAIRRRMSTADSLFFMDGVHPQHNPIVQCGWFKKGVEVTIKTNTQYHRVHINGAVDIETLDIVSITAQRLNEESTLDFLEKLRKVRPKGWLYLVLDNAGYYQTKRVKEYAKILKIKLIYLPPYSPNLNVIERLWQFLKKEILYNHYYETFDEFRKECIKFMKNLRYRKNELVSLLTENFELIG